MGVKHWYGETEIEWGDGEWKRLQEIKDRKLFKAEGCEAAVSITVSHELKDKIFKYASAHNTNASQLIREVMFVLTQ